MRNRKPWSFCETPKEKCTMNYCDENGCQNRKRVLVDAHQYPSCGEMRDVEQMCNPNGACDCCQEEE